MASSLPTAKVALVTGVGRWLGEQVAAALAAEPSLERIIGVDTVAPRPGSQRLGRTEFVRADIANPLIGTVLDQARVDLVVHAGTLRSVDRPGSATLLEACSPRPVGAPRGARLHHRRLRQRPG